MLIRSKRASKRGRSPRNSGIAHLCHTPHSPLGYFTLLVLQRNSTTKVAIYSSETTYGRHLYSCMGTRYQVQRAMNSRNQGTRPRVRRRGLDIKNRDAHTILHITQFCSYWTMTTYLARIRTVFNDPETAEEYP